MEASVIDNPCLRPACLDDIPRPLGVDRIAECHWVWRADFLELLYDAEWRLRGYKRSP